MKLKKWIDKEVLSDSLNTPLSSKILENKGFDEKERGAFLHPVFNGPYNLREFSGFEETVELLKKWIELNKKICIYCDYDVDGTSAAAILIRMFNYLNYKNFFYYVPNRFEEGYGLNDSAIRTIFENGADSIITVDCGIRAVEPVALAKNLGMDVIVTDHHSLPPILPKADLILNPKLSKEESKHYELCGAGVAMYLALGVLCYDEKTDYLKYSELIQLAGIATISDLVPLLGENRAIVKFALDIMREKPIVGVKALMDVSGKKLDKLVASDIGFAIGPRINAAGRMGFAEKAIELLISDDEEEATLIARDLDAHNQNRRSVQNEILDESINLINADPKYTESGMVIVWGTGWHEGVLGIVASNLVELYHMPAIVMSYNSGELKGSGRSIEGFSLYDAVNFASANLTRFGGHKMACGLSLLEENLTGFVSDVKEYCDANLTDDILIPKLDVCGELPFRYITFDGVDELGLLEPFGVGNEEPLFTAKDFSLNYSSILGKKKDTLKLNLIKENRLFDAIMFKINEKDSIPKHSRVDIAFKLSLNRYNGITSLQCALKDFRNYNPSAPGFPSYAFSLYAKELVEKILYGEGDFVLENGRKVDKTKVLGLLSRGEKIGVNSFESLLSSMYLMFDAGYLPDKISSPEMVLSRIKILPNLKDNVRSFYGEKGFYGTYVKERKLFYKSTILSQLEFNRDNFVAVYYSLKKYGKISIYKLLSLNPAPINAMLALCFFEEANFIRRLGKDVEIVEGDHSRVDYDESLTKSKVDAFLNSIV